MKKIALPFLLILVVSFSSSVKAEFSDVPSSSEYYQSIATLQELGIVQGYENGQFDQNRLVSRAEFLKMALLADIEDKKPSNTQSGIPVFPGIENVKVSLSCFPDLKETDWFAPYVCWAKENGMISGYPDGNFYPHQTVNASEAAKILAKGQDNYAKGHWANGYFQQLAPHTLTSSILKADQLLNRADTAEMTWRYHLATDKQLALKPSKILVWDEDKFLNLDYIGNTQHYVLGYLYAKDGKNVYGIEYMNGDYLPKIIPGADLQSFKVYSDEVFNENSEDGKIDFSMASDNNHLYIAGEPVSDSAGGEFKLYDQSFSDEYTFLYGHDKKYAYQIWCYEGCQLTTQFKDSDGNSFQPLDAYYSKDKNNVYYNYSGEKGDDFINPIVGADATSFESLEDGYAKDKAYFYLKDEIVQGADPTSIEPLIFRGEDATCPSEFFKDKSNLFLGTQLIPNVKIDSFEFLHDYGVFFKDSEHVYRLTREGKGSLCSPDNAIVLDGINTNDFKAFGVSYFTSQEKAYYVNNSGEPKLMEGVDLASFEGFSDNSDLPFSDDGSDTLAKDKNYIYYSGEPLEGVDVNTFHVIDKIVGADSQLYNWADKNKSYSWADLGKMAGLY